MVSRRSKTKTDQILTPPPKIKQADLQRALGHVEAMWSELERSSKEDSQTLLSLPNPYFASSDKPYSGYVMEEMRYWDSYFVALGLLKSQRSQQAYEQADNLLHLLRRFGFIPHSNRMHATSRSHPPMLTSLLLELYYHGASKEWLGPRMELAKSEYEAAWRSALHPHSREVFAGLSRNYDASLVDELAEYESGWDFTTRFYGSALDYIPIDLNALLYKYETDFERAALILGKPEEAKQWQKRAQERRASVDEYLWNQSSGFYFDYNYKLGKQSRVWSLAGYYPLWAGMASEEQAEMLVGNIDKFEAVGGLTATRQYPHIREHHPVQWGYPNGWAPLHLLVVRGCAWYGYEDVAARIAQRWLHTNLHSFNRHGVFFDKYNVVDLDQPPKDGMYPLRTGYAWSNAVFAVLANDMAEYLA